MNATTEPTYAPHQLRVIQEKTDLDDKRGKLRAFVGDTPKFFALDPADRMLLENQLHIMDGYSAVLGHRIARFKHQGQRGQRSHIAMQPLDNDGKAHP